VVNAFSFTGGFSLYAARGGARSVTDLDLSEHALAGARRNFALNQAATAVAACRHDCVRADALEWLATTPARTFDLIVLDPPSLAKREVERARAIGAYRRLSGDALRCSLPVACSWRRPVQPMFRPRSSSAPCVRRRARAATVQRTADDRPRPDHPATFPEARYLKAIYLRFG